METIAVYWEPRIKTYGFTKVRGLSLIKFGLSSAQMSEAGLELWRLGDAGVEFYLILGQDLGGQGLSMQMLIRDQWEQKIVECVEQVISREPGGVINVIPSVGLIHFYGPHFGDRYGIADTVFDALAKGDVPLLAAGCSASSIYLVFPEERLSESEKILSEVFELPGS